MKNKTINFTHQGIDYTLKFNYQDATITGGNLNENMFVEYLQEGDRVRWEVWDEDVSVMKLEGFYDGKKLNSIKEIDAEIFDSDIYGEITYIIKCDF